MDSPGPIFLCLGSTLFPYTFKFDLQEPKAYKTTTTKTITTNEIDSKATISHFMAVILWTHVNKYSQRSDKS